MYDISIDFLLQAAETAQNVKRVRATTPLIISNDFLLTSRYILESVPDLNFRLDIKSKVLL